MALLVVQTEDLRDSIALDGVAMKSAVEGVNSKNFSFIPGCQVSSIVDCTIAPPAASSARRLLLASTSAWSFFGTY